jgi:hypothetical protein
VLKLILYGNNFLLLDVGEFRMHYAYDVWVLPENISSNHVEVPIKLAAGIITHVTIIFPPGCARLIRCTLWDNANQLLPTNIDATYGEDAYAVEIECYYPTWLFGNEFTVLAWNVGALYKHLIHVMIDVQGVDEPDISKAIETLYKTVESLTTVLKGLY